MEGIDEAGVASAGASFERLGEILGAFEESSGDSLRGWRRALLWTTLTGAAAAALLVAMTVFQRGSL
jgi:hypothetical protein